MLVTYHGNNYLPEGQSNLDKMAEAFNCDHYIFHPGVESLKKINKLAFSMMGDMNWHAHAGIFTYPIRVAVEKKIPLVMPPDYNELPIPKEKIEQTDINENEFKTLITQTNQDTESDSNEEVDKSFEELLLKKIKKN